jgi:hypothetical protein
MGGLVYDFKPRILEADDHHLIVRVQCWDLHVLKRLGLGPRELDVLKQIKTGFLLVLLKSLQ